eukprot:GHVU01109660.1.p1 GENE.GHVU01109660.1~~GHVU01109660.1.p1  ORF type:complete len:214 (-),score=19.92 GHVU01109660.1:388-1029(-)
MKVLETKVVVLGSQGVGKTSVVTRYFHNEFDQHRSPTIGASFLTCKLQLKDYQVKLQVWDTAGQERFKCMAPMYYRRANAALLVYDITSPSSFESMKSWVQELFRNVEQKIIICVIGNKTDLEKERRVSREDAEDFAESVGASHYETSALSGQGIQDVFLKIATILVDLQETEGGLNVIQTYSGSSENGDAQGVNVHVDPKDSETSQRRFGCC